MILCLVAACGTEGQGQTEVDAPPAVILEADWPGTYVAAGYFCPNTRNCTTNIVPMTMSVARTDGQWTVTFVGNWTFPDMEMTFKHGALEGSDVICLYYDTAGCAAKVAARGVSKPSRDTLDGAFQIFHPDGDKPPPWAETWLSFKGATRQ
jgi:hypothetical protein